MLVACALAADGPGDEAANRKLLALWKSDPERMMRLHKNYLALRALPREQHERLQQLDRELHQLDSATQARLRAVMERYAGWLYRLTADERDKINAAPAGPERLKLVDEQLEKEWLRSLPKLDQDKLAKATGDERTQLIEQLHKDEEERRKLRLQARRTIEEAAVLGPLPFGQPEFRSRVETFVEESLRPLLSRQEEDRLNAMAKGTWQRYFQTVYELSEGRSPLPFPGPAPPGRKKAVRWWKDLPVSITEKFPDPVPASISEADGRWPQLPMALAAVAKEKGIVMTWSMLGPTKMDELPPAAQRFVRDDLMNKLNENEKKQLSDTQGTWPEYPMKVKELADKHRLIVPGLSLPGTRELWQNMLRAFRPGKAGMP
jgi:hypothetical protein